MIYEQAVRPLASVYSFKSIYQTLMPIFLKQWTRFTMTISGNGRGEEWKGSHPGYSNSTVLTPVSSIESSSNQCQLLETIEMKALHCRLLFLIVVSSQALSGLKAGILTYDGFFNLFRGLPSHPIPHNHNQYSADVVNDCR